MKTIAFRTLLSTAGWAGLAMASALAQQGLPPGSRAPTTKIYLSEAEGESAIVSKGVTYTAQQAKSFDAPGTVIETKDKAHNAFVYSNGTGLYMEQNTKIHVERFAQERFQPNSPTRTNPEIEPSVSHSNVVVNRGIVGICTNQLATGTTMLYTTPLARVEIRRGRLSIETTDKESIIDLLEGDITVHNGASDKVGQVLRPGDRVIIRAAADGQPATLTLIETPKEFAQPLDERTNVACNAKKTVFFDANDAADQEISANPAVPARLPTNVTVSPDRLPGT